MNQTNLEGLMMDDALGALLPEVSELLAAYLQTAPSGEEEMRRWRGIVDVAGRAMAPVGARELPPFPWGRVRRANRLRVAGGIMALAAAMMIGIGIDRYRRPPSPREGNVEVSQALAVPATVDDFWSSRRLLALAGSVHEARHSRWQWTSPDRQPVPGELR